MCHCVMRQHRVVCYPSSLHATAALGEVGVEAGLASAGGENLLVK